MHTFIFAVTTATTTAKKSSSSSSLTFLLLIVALAAVYFLFLRPRSQKARQQRQQQATSFGVGDEIQTIGGIRGIVVAIEDDDVEVQVAPDTVLTFVKQAVRPRPDAASNPAASSPAASNPSGRPSSRPAAAEPEDTDDEWPMPGGLSSEQKGNSNNANSGADTTDAEGHDGGSASARGQD